ncbi:hypothetical protein AHF37_02527 [Paragonimus kellicotti]|nr:hypothetical protein AHF37_02527 [Paragonimus kellicotti]
MENIDSATLKCTTLLTGYLGEHQSQLFYDHMLIRDIQLGGEPLPPIPVTIGQPVPIDLSDQCGRPTNSSLPALCLAVHYFQRPPLVRCDKVNLGSDSREYPNPNPSVSFNGKPHSEDTGIASDTNCICTCVDSLDSKTSLCNSSTKQNQESVRQGDTRLKLEPAGYNFLVTLLVYYPIAHMKTANDLCSMTDQNKNIHLPPHPHEFVAYPKMLTLPIEEVGSRIVWGYLIANRLVPNSLDVSNSLTFSQIQHDGCCVTDDEKLSTTPIRTCQLDQQLAGDERSARSSLLLSDPVRYLQVGICIIVLAYCNDYKKEGWKLSQLKVPEMSIGRLWYSKQLVWKPNGDEIAPEPSQTCPSEDTTAQSMEMTKNSTSLSVLSWLGLRVQSARSRIMRNMPAHNTGNPVGLMQSDESEENTSATCVNTVNVRMVFVRRESFECGDAICDSIRSSRFPPVNKIRFVIASRNLYNRIGVLQRLQKEGWKLSQLKVPEMSIGRLWYSKQLVWKPNGDEIAPEPSQTCPSEDTTAQSMEMTKNSTSLSVLSWLGLRVQSARSRIMRNMPAHNTGNPVGLMQSDESEENTSATCVNTVNVRMVFVRRESFECGDAICDSIRSSRFPPAKLRRTRLRGTTQSGIKLKRDGRRAIPLTENPNETDDSQPSPEKRYRTDHEAALCVLTGASAPSEQSSTIYPYPLPWEEQSGVQHRYDSPLSPTSLIHSSIATRVKRGAYLCRRREDRPNCVDRKVNESELELNLRTKHDELAFDVVYQPRNRMPPKRFDLTDRDLELALQRSLTDCAKTCTSAKRKSPVPVNISPEMRQQLQPHPNSCSVDSDTLDNYVPANTPDQPATISNGEHSVNECIVKASLSGKNKVRSSRPKMSLKSVHKNLPTSDESKQCIPSDTGNCGNSTQAEGHDTPFPHELEITKRSRRRNQKQSPNNTFPTKTLEEEATMSRDQQNDGTPDLELQQQLIPKIHLLKTLDGKFTVLDGPGETEETPRRNSADGKWDDGEDLRKVCNSDETLLEVNVSNSERLVLHPAQSVGINVLPELTSFSQNKPFEHRAIPNGPLNLSGKDAVETENDIPRSSAWTLPNPSQAIGPPTYTTDNTGPLIIQSPNSTLSAVPKTTIQRANLANEPMLINTMHNATTEHSIASITNTPSLPTGHTLLTHDKTYPFPVGNAFWPSYCYPTIPHQEQLPCSPQAPIFSSPFTEMNKISTTQQLGYPHSFLPYWDSQVGSPMFHTVPVTPIPSSNQVALAFPSSLTLSDCSQNVLYYHPFVNSDQHFPLFSNPVPSISYATLPPTCDTTTALAVFPAPCQLQFIT